MKLSVIVISYNTKDLLHQTLSSIPTMPDGEIIVVDNHSTDGSVAMIKAEFPNVRLIENSKNLGFAKANNQAIKMSRADYVMLLNSDTQLITGAISALVEYMDTHPKVGAITPKVILPDGKLDPACHRGLPTPWRSFCYYAGLERLFPHSVYFAGYHQGHLNLDTTHQIETTAATAMVVRRQTIDQVGSLDEQFFLYGEDLDWCKRMTDQGWQIIYLPAAQVIHYKSQSGKNHAAAAEKRIAAGHFYDTMKQFYEKHYRHTYPDWLRWIVYRGIDVKKWLATH